MFTDDTKKNNEGTEGLSDAQSIHVASEETAEQLSLKMKDIELKKKEQLMEQRGAELGFDYINLKGFPIGPEIISLIPEDMAKKNRVIAFFHQENRIRIASVDPQSTGVSEATDALKKIFPEAEIKVYITSEHSFDQAFDLYKAVAKIRKIKKDLEITKSELDRLQKLVPTYTKLEEQLQKANMSEKVLLILATAIQEGSSDIHIEAEEKDIVIRLRIDGMLRIVAHLPLEVWPQMINRMKGIAGLKININTVPQDGRITVDLEGEKLDLRVSTLPSAYGESVVMRLLYSKTAALSFDDLGLRGKAYQDLLREVQRPNGMILTTGPTGSGKTTTLYAILNKLNSPEVKIISLEDPIEYKLQGVIQSQVDPLRKYTFARGLRAILRQDPDIVMVGEIRDIETAEIAIQAALTGHLVISTIHTNDASGAIPRFLSMGVKPFLLAPAINAVIGQRLVRKVCQQCKIEDEVAPDQLAEIKNILGDIPSQVEVKVDLEHLSFFKGQGCDHCYEGYKGRIGIYEIFAMNEKIEAVVLSGEVSEYKMKDLAHDYGMITMVQDGLLKALDGITTVSEVFRVAKV